MRKWIIELFTDGDRETPVEEKYCYAQDPIDMAQDIRQFAAENEMYDDNGSPEPSPRDVIKTLADNYPNNFWFSLSDNRVIKVTRVS